MSIRDLLIGANNPLHLGVTPLDVSDTDWPDGLFVHKLSGSDVEKYQAELKEDEDNPESIDISWIRRTCNWIMLCLYDKNGNKVFDADSDMDALMNEHSFDTLNKIGDRVISVNGMKDDSIDDAKKNSSPTGENSDGTSSAEQSSTAQSGKRKKK